MHKNNSRDSSEFRGCSPIQLHRKLKVCSSAVGYYSYTERSYAIVRSASQLHMNGRRLRHCSAHLFRCAAQLHRTAAKRNTPSQTPTGICSGLPARFSIDVVKRQNK